MQWVGMCSESRLLLIAQKHEEGREKRGARHTFARPIQVRETAMA